MKPEKRGFTIEWKPSLDCDGRPMINEDGSPVLHRETTPVEFNPLPIENTTPVAFKVTCSCCSLQKACKVKAVPEACRKEIECSVCKVEDKDGNVIPVVHDLALGFPECPAVISNR